MWTAWVRIGLGLAAAWLAGCGGAGAREGRPAPPLNLPNLAGERVTLDVPSGGATLVCFWATWAAPCRISMPEWTGVQRNYARRGLKLIGAVVQDEPKAVQAYLKRRPLNFPVVVADGPTVRAWLGRGDIVLPVAFLVGADGRVARRFVGFRGYDELAAAVQSLLAAQPTIQVAREAP